MKLLILSLALITSAAAFAQDGSSATSVDASSNSSQLKASDIVPSQTKREDIDDEITNARLRASTGAKSLWSIQSAFNYNGGSVQKPLSKERPVLSPGTALESDVKLTGSIAIKYRATDHDSFNAGFGLGWLTPGQTGQKGQSEDPYVGYTRMFKAGKVQNVFDINMTKYTAESAVESKDNFNFYTDYSALVDLGTTRWQVGVNAAWSRDFYTENTGGIQDALALYPFAEYSFTDKVSFRTVYRGLTYFNTQDAAGTFHHDAPTQSAGIGLAMTRDIYLYPNIQWVSEEARADKTNVALSAYINL